MDSESSLPAFRKDIKVFLGPQEADGTPTYNLYDPVKGQYYKITWLGKIILNFFKPGMTLKFLQNKIMQETPLQPALEELESFFLQARSNGLLQVHLPSDEIITLSEKNESSWSWWFLTHYLYFRIPLIKPDKFLKATINYARVFVTYPMLILYAVFFLVGITTVISRWDEYLHTFLNFLSLEGLLGYAVGITLIKFIHELSHAYTATSMGIRVPSIGVAFIVLWPVLYTDVTHGWRLADRRKRFLISAAGIIGELILAGIATFGWALSSPGIFQSLCYIISTTSLFRTLVINLNPALRFDGYYLLCDMWGIDNLQERSFNIGRWKLHQFLFGIEAPCPEPDLSSSTVLGMTIYAIYTWMYRIFLYTAIAIFVYFAFTKSLGFILFLSEILIFFVWPIYTETREVFKVKKYFKSRKRLFITLTIFSLLLAWFIIPLPHIYSFKAFTVPDSWQVVYVPEDSEIEEIFIKRLETVKKGEPLIKLKSIQLDELLNQAKLEENIQKIHVEKAEIDEFRLAALPQEKAILDELKEKKQQLINRVSSLDVRAEIDGVVFEWDKNLFEGEYLSKGVQLGKIADLQKIKIYTLIPEDDIKNVQLGIDAEFYIPSSNIFYSGKITKIQPFRAKDFTYMPLASTVGGSIPVVEKGNRLEILESYYIAEIQIEENEHLFLGQSGYVRWRGAFRSYAVEFFRYVYQVILRESGF